MARKKKAVEDVDGKSAAAGETMDPMDAGEYVFDGPFDAQKAVDALVELNHERVRCAALWEEAKTEAANAKKDLDDATNAITLLIDRIDAAQNGRSEQPALKTVNSAAEATV